MRAEQIQALQGLQGSLGHADRAGIPFRQAVVALVTPFPDAVIADAIGPGDVVHEVLDEIRLIAAAHHRQSGSGELGQLQQKQGGGIQLQMAPGVIGHHRITIAAVVLGMQRVERIKTGLEPLHLGGLAQHRSEQPAHQGEHPLVQFPNTAAVLSGAAAVGHRQGPDALDRVHAISDPGIAVVPVDGVGGAGWKQPADGVLAVQNNAFNRTVELFQLSVRVGSRGGFG